MVAGPQYGASQKSCCWSLSRPVCGSSLPMPLHARTYPPRCTLLPLFAAPLCSAPCKDLLSKAVTASHVCVLLFALARVRHTKTYLPRPSLQPLFTASVCPCACARYKDKPLQAVTAPFICSFCLFLHTRCCHQHRAVMLFALHWGNRGL